MINNIKAISGDVPLGLQDHVHYFFLACGEIFNYLKEKRGSKPNFFIPLKKYPHLIDEPYSPFRVLQEAYFREALTTIAMSPVKILEVGCGRGQNYKIFKQQIIKGTYLGIDPGRSKDGTLFDNVSDEWRNIMKETEKKALKCEFKKNTIFEIAKLKQTFNCITTCSVLEHIDDLPRAIKIMSTLLQAGGVMAHTVPAPFSYFIYGPHGNRRFSGNQLFNLFKSEKTDCKVYALGGLFSFFIHFLFITFPTKILKKDVRKAIPKLYNMLLYLSIKLDNLFPFLHTGFGVIVTKKA